MQNDTIVQRTSDRELVVSRTIHASSHVVFDAWSKPELFAQWWVPKSAPISLVSCELDVRVGGGYRLVFRMGEKTMVFWCKYLDVVPNSRIVWTNDECGEERAAVTTVTFEACEGGTTRLTMHDLHPSNEALDETLTFGATDCTAEVWDQFVELLATQPR